ncbi:hypothetical protein ABZ801_29350 [Actinomadura sp. NPDC047616]|uniref:hypothetical protein n=1 Tax=Actinomadura sp. NPDC047616 TaxID=3155914 RepID=UPI0033F2E1CA
MRNWTKNVSRAAVVAAGAVALGSGACVGLASAGAADGTGGKRSAITIDQDQVQPGRARATRHECDDMSGLMGKAHGACALSEDKDDDWDRDGFDGDDDGFVGMWGGSNGPISAYGGALAMVNITKSFTYGGGQDHCSRCDDSYDDDYAPVKSHKAKPKKYKAKKYKAKKYKAKPRKVKAHKAKPRKVRSYKARSSRPKAPHWSRPVKVRNYGYNSPLPSTERHAADRSGRKFTVPTALGPGRGRVGTFVSRLVKPVADVRVAAKRHNQEQEQELVVRSTNTDNAKDQHAKALR